MPSFTLHIGNKNYSSWSLRAWLLLKELNIPFDEVLHPFDPVQGNQARFEQFSPSARVPCLVDEDLTIWDTLAIFEYVAEIAAVWSDRQGCSSIQPFGVRRDSQRMGRYSYAMPYELLAND